MLDVVLNIVLVLMLVSFFNFIRYMFKIRKVMKMHKDNPNIKGITIVNGEVKVIEKESTPIQPKEEIIELITDPICGKQIRKEEAYRILKEGKEHFFCSWDCREKFLEEH